MKGNQEAWPGRSAGCFPSTRLRLYVCECPGLCSKSLPTPADRRLCVETAGGGWGGDSQERGSDLMSEGPPHLPVPHDLSQQVPLIVHDLSENFPAESVGDVCCVVRNSPVSGMTHPDDHWARVHHRVCP